MNTVLKTTLRESNTKCQGSAFMKFWSKAYNLIIFIISPVLGAILLTKSRGRNRWLERFGFWNLRIKQPTIWFHAASLGETRGLIPLVNKLKESFNDHHMLLTCTSPTGFEAGKGYFDSFKILPIDTTCFHANAANDLNLRALIVSETELWPGLVLYSKKRRLPIFQVNGRISDFTMQRYELIKPLTKEILDSIDKIMVSSIEATDRFIKLGAKAEQVVLTGNSKYDGINQIPLGEREDFRNRFRLLDLPTICLGSVREGEEDLWFTAVKNLYSEGLKFNLIVAPRHREKFEHFADSLRSRKLPFIRYTQHESPTSAQQYNSNSEPQILLLDTYGKLLHAYAASQIAFIGATLVNIGGHNPFEAAAQGCAVIVGPNVQNIKDEVRDLKSNDALINIKDENDIKDLIKDFLKDPKKFSAIGSRGQSVWKNHQGSSEKAALQIVNRLLEKKQCQ